MHPSEMDVRCLDGLGVALRSFDIFENYSNVHISYEYFRLFSKILLVQFQLAQLHHRITQLRAGQNRKDKKSSHEEDLPEIPSTLKKCSALKEALESEFHDLMVVVRGDADTTEV